MSRSFKIPARVVYGEGALEEAAPVVAGLGTKALVVTDATMVTLGNLEPVARMLEAAGATHAVFDGVDSEPTDKIVRAGVEVFLREGCDMLVALGGGSPIDTMKAIALAASTGRDIDSFMGEAFEGAVYPLVAIPTTAGTGSEATQFTIITDTERDIKMLLSSPALMPELAVIDPRFTLSAPGSVTKATGIDALCHAVEAYTSRRAQPLSDTFALSAAKRIFRHLRTCYTDPGNVEARTQMSIAATEAGIAFNNASVTIIHGMSRPIGALFHVPHGISNAMLMKACLAFALDGAPERFADIARACGLSDAADDLKAAHDFMDGLAKLLADVDIPTLAEYGIDRDDYHESIPKMARDAAASGSPANTIKPVSVEDMEQLYRELYR